MEPFTKALEVVVRVMREGAATHPDNDWVGRSPDYHLGRAEEHLRLWRDGDQLEDHMSHAATRLLMALTLREVDAIGKYRRNRPDDLLNSAGLCTDADELCSSAKPRDRLAEPYGLIPTAVSVGSVTHVRESLE